MQREYTAIFKKSGKWVVAWIEEIPGVNAQGRTMKEARENLREALKMMLDLRREDAKQYPTAKRENFRVTVPAIA